MSFPQTSTSPRFAVLAVSLGAMTTACGGAAPRPHHPEIVQLGNPTLRTKAHTVAPESIASPEFQALVDRMIRVMREAPGVGLAAPQLGIPLRVFVMEDRAEYLARQTKLEVEERGRVAYPVKVWINPEVTVHGSAQATFFEGCLSFAGFAAVVERPLEVEIRGLDRHGEPQLWRVTGWPARTIQHELDHLDGVVYVDRMHSRSLMELNAAKARFAGKRASAIIEELGLERPGPSSASTGSRSGGESPPAGP